MLMHVCLCESFYCSLISNMSVCHSSPLSSYTSKYNIHNRIQMKSGRQRRRRDGWKAFGRRLIHMLCQFPVCWPTCIIHRVYWLLANSIRWWSDTPKNKRCTLAPGDAFDPFQHVDWTASSGTHLVMGMLSLNRIDGELGVLGNSPEPTWIWGLNQDTLIYERHVSRAVTDTRISIFHSWYRLQCRYLRWVIVTVQQQSIDRYPQWV